MTFEEQPVEQLYSTLMPEDEKPDPVDEMFGAFADIGRAGVDVAAHAFRPRWPWDTWSYTDIVIYVPRHPHPITTI